MTAPTYEQQIAQIQDAIASLEARRAQLGDAAVDTSVAALREKLSTLRREPAARQRKLVTVLFADLVGFTPLAESLDPEDVRELLERYFEPWREAIAHFDGRLEKYIGDAVMAVFGVPVATETDGENAIRAALAVRDGLGQLNADLERRFGIRLAMRVGIHTGPVLVAEARGAGDLAVTGDTVQVASRLEGQAPADGILISHNTYRQVRGVFDVRAQPPLVVKGKAEPVQTYLVQRAKPRAWRVPSRGVEGVETRMVGRDVELLALQEAYRKAADGHETRVVMVVGEPGVGKSRLLDEFTNWVELERERVWYLRGRASAEGRAVAYSLWRDLFAYRFDILETDTAAQALTKFRQGMAGLLEAERADLVGQMVGFDFSASPAVVALLGSESFAKLASAYLGQYLRGLAGQLPVVVLLEDLHWADDSSLDLLAQVVEGLPEEPLLVVGAARPELYERRPNWGEGQEATARLELKPLSKRASRALVLEILQRVREVPEAVQKIVVEGAEGNPFYAEELVKMLIEDGAIVPGEEEWHVELERLAQVRVPTTLMALLQARLDTLPRDEREVLQRASVVGREFWSSLVGELASDALGAEEVVLLLGALRGRELVYRRERSAFAGTEEYLFKHAVLRDVTYETVLLRLRRRYHAQVAAWLEGHAGERLSEYLSLIARHYELAGEGERAADYYRRSGEELFKVGASRDAARAFEQALALLAALPEVEEGTARAASQAGRARQRSTLAVELGKARMRLGELAEAARQFESGRAQAEAIGEQGSVATALGGLCEAQWRQDDLEAAERSARHALALAQQGGDRALEAQSAYVLSAVLGDRGRREEEGHWAEVGWSLYSQARDRQGMAAALLRLANWAYSVHEMERAKGFLRQAMGLAREIGDRWLLAGAMTEMERTLPPPLDYEAAESRVLEAQALAAEIGAKEMEAWLAGRLAYWAFTLERDEEAARWAEIGRAICRKLGLRREEYRMLHRTGDVRLVQGDLDGARQIYAEELGLAREAGHSYFQSSGLRGLGWVAYEQGAYAEAHAYFGQALANDEALGNWGNIAFDWGFDGYACAAQGDHRQAAECMRKALEQAVQLHDLFGILWVLPLAADAEMRQGRLERAAELAGRALHDAESHRWAKREARRAIARLRAALPAAPLEAALARAAELDLERVVAEILAGDTPQASGGRAGKEASMEQD